MSRRERELEEANMALAEAEAMYKLAVTRRERLVAWRKCRRMARWANTVCRRMELDRRHHIML